MSAVALLMYIMTVLGDVVRPAPAPPPPETKDRLPPDRMEALVSAPMALVRQGRLEAADAVFRAQRARAAAADPSRRQEADLLTAYGILLYTEGMKEREDDVLQEAAIPWLREAVKAARTGWGPVHPETALALQDLGDALSRAGVTKIPAEAEQALAEAYSIRRQTLGPEDRETQASWKALTRVREARLKARSRPS